MAICFWAYKAILNMSGKIVIHAFFANNFCDGYAPSCVGFDCKGSENFAIVQIFQLKV